jgi:hypothetical protein
MGNGHQRPKLRQGTGHHINNTSKDFRHGMKRTPPDE